MWDNWCYYNYICILLVKLLYIFRKLPIFRRLSLCKNALSARGFNCIQLFFCSFQPCRLQKCTSYTYCGIKDKHPEYFAEMNKLKTAIKKKRDEIKGLQEQLTGIKTSVSQSEHQFIKALTPRMVKMDPTYKLNKQKLLRDIRILRKFYCGNNKRCGTITHNTI